MSFSLPVIRCCYIRFDENSQKGKSYILVDHSRLKDIEDNFFCSSRNVVPHLI